MHIKKKIFFSDLLFGYYRDINPFLIVNIVFFSAYDIYVIICKIKRTYYYTNRTNKALHCFFFCVAKKLPKIKLN